VHELLVVDGAGSCSATGVRKKNSTAYTDSPYIKARLKWLVVDGAAEAVVLRRGNYLQIVPVLSSLRSLHHVHAGYKPRSIKTTRSDHLRRSATGPHGTPRAWRSAHLGQHPIVTLGKQLLNRIGNMAKSG
jgi:hypothetical protein